MRFAPFFFFVFEFRPNSAVLADTGRYEPSRPDLGRVGADFSCVGPIREQPRGTTRHGRAVCGVPPASCRVGRGCAGLDVASVHPRLFLPHFSVETSSFDLFLSLSTPPPTHPKEGGGWGPRDTLIFILVLKGKTLFFLVSFFL